MLISVLVPTYRRPADLERCLLALGGQSRAADRIIVIRRVDDGLTHVLLQQARWAALPLQVETVAEPGVVAALNRGLAATVGDIVAITDDDGTPHADWLLRIEAHFARDPSLGGVGGRDIIPGLALAPGEAAPEVGRLQWFGRHIGNHHLGAGAAREVDMLKGVNMSFRRAALTGLAFDRRLRGTGAQVHNEIGLSLALRRAGWRLLYDPAVLVDHVRAERHDEDQRKGFNALATANAAHNATLLILDHLGPLRRAAFLGWAALIGTRDAYGLAQWSRFALRDRAHASRMLAASWRGRLEGFATWRRSRRALSGKAR